MAVVFGEEENGVHNGVTEFVFRKLVNHFGSIGLNTAIVSEFYLNICIVRAAYTLITKVHLYF